MRLHQGFLFKAHLQSCSDLLITNFVGFLFEFEASNGVGLDASGTFARPPALASGYNDIYIPRNMELKGWITDCTRSSFQGRTLNEVKLFTMDLQKMVPNELHQCIEWDLTRTEQGNWLTKTIVNVWFKNETLFGNDDRSAQCC